MNFIERKKRVNYLLEMIEKGHCISTHQVAKKFNCCSKTVKRLIDELREEGHKVKYCKSARKFLLK